MADPNQVILTVGDEKITVKEYDTLVGALPPQYQTAARGAQKRQFAERLVQLKVLSKEAEKRNLDQQPTVKQQLAFDRQNVLAGALYTEMVKSAKVDDESARKYYNDHKADFEQAKGRHILIRFKGSQVPLRAGEKELTDEEALAKAQDLRKKLLAGGDFATLAKAESDDAGSGTNGGDLGTFKHGQMVPAFEQAAFALPAGQVSEPVKTQFGYHLIKVDEKQAKSFEEAKPEITEKLGPEIAKKELDELRKKSPVTFDDAYFGPAAPAQ
ncbi:MAG: PpiC-type peptidyl-prolyl cis-trans isomerase [Bryobacterales bacterium]|nr:PpiC-type peptidyl-prolyl cis-trans isomerase [Bryobacterales bacterium]